MTPTIYDTRAEMIRRLTALLGTGRLSHWENQFMCAIRDLTFNGALVTTLSEPMERKIEEIYRRHCG